MKVGENGYPVIPFQLYIPHGSDESPSAKKYPPAQNIFISHMVQMKGLTLNLVIYAFSNFISHMVQMKAVWSFVYGSKPELYIPHGSDES